MSAVDVVCLWLGRAWSALILLALATWAGTAARDALFRWFDRHAKPALDEPISYVPAPPEREWPPAVELAIIQALLLSRQGLPCPPVLADEIAGRRRAKAGQS